MITIAAVLQRFENLDAETLHIWIEQDWIRPPSRAGEPMFEEIDIARLRLILELRNDLALGDPAIPVVLSLLDQLHATRAALRQALTQHAPR